MGTQLRPDALATATKLALSLQKTGQGDGETLEIVVPQMVSILVWEP